MDCSHATVLSVLHSLGALESVDTPGLFIPRNRAQSLPCATAVSKGKPVAIAANARTCCASDIPGTTDSSNTPAFLNLFYLSFLTLSFSPANASNGDGMRTDPFSGSPVNSRHF